MPIAPRRRTRSQQLSYITGARLVGGPGKEHIADSPDREPDNDSLLIDQTMEGAYFALERSQVLRRQGAQDGEERRGQDMCTVLLEVLHKGR